MKISTRQNLLSVDLEDWHTSAYLRNYVTDDNFSSRITESTLPIIELFKRKNVKATFFVLGSIAEKYPQLIREISDEGHEIASHGFSHTPLWNLSPENFRNEIRKTNDILESITGKKVKGFRAPYASLEKKTAWAINILEEEGFAYDSSIFPLKTPLYGVSNAPQTIYKISSTNLSEHDAKAKIVEVPFTIFHSGLIKIPCTGGIYGRFIPISLLFFFYKQINKKNPVNFYFHPWETDTEMARIKAPAYNTIVSYYGVKNYLTKIESVIDGFCFTSFKEYLQLTE